MKIAAMRSRPTGAKLDTTGGRAPSPSLPRLRGREGEGYRSGCWADGIGLAAAALVCASGPMAHEAAAEMTREPTAIIQGLDKVAARVSRFEAPVGRAVHYGKLLVLVRDCERSAPEDRPENAAFAEIYEERPGEAKERLFAGWMFSSSPALSALEHPVYDVTLLECKGAAPPASAPAPAAASTDKPSGRSRTKTAR